MRQSQGETEGEQLGLKKDLTFSFHQPAIVKPPFINSYKQFKKYGMYLHLSHLNVYFFNSVYKFSLL